mgnify:CR=1 FL=1
MDAKNTTTIAPLSDASFKKKLAVGRRVWFQEWMIAYGQGRHKKSGKDR